MMEQYSYWAQFRDSEIEIEYDEYGVTTIDCLDFRISVTNDWNVIVSFYTGKGIVFIRNVLALAEWCEEGL